MAEGIVLNDETWGVLRQMLQHWQRAGAWSAPAINRGLMLEPKEPKYIKNDSGETIPPYACCQVTGTIEIHGQNYLVVDKPADTDGTSGSYVFNGHAAIESTDEGKYQTGPVVRAYKNSGSPTAGDQWGPTVSQWYVSSGTGSFIVAGDDDIGTNVLKLFTSVTGGSSNCKLVITPGGGIAARSGTSVSSASCNLVGITTGTIGATSGSITVHNPWPVVIPASYYVTAKQESETGVWIADFPGVINVRWVSPDLEQTLDGGTYVNIDTAEECA